MQSSSSKIEIAMVSPSSGACPSFAPAAPAPPVSDTVAAHSTTVGDACNGGCSSTGFDHHHYTNQLVAQFPSIIGPRPPCKYRVRRAIGRGAYSTVWLLVNNMTGARVVGKLLESLEKSGSHKEFARAEMENMKRCDHPNIVSFIEMFESDDKLLFILEYANAGDLQRQLDTRAQPPLETNGGRAIPYNEEEVLVIFAQLCLAVHYLHHHRIMHRDLKTPNVLLTRSGLVKLGDFGFSRQYQESVSGDVGNTFCGTPYYLAPELWQRQSYSYKADIWSLGVIIYELMTLKKPFQAGSLAELMEVVTQQGNFEPLPTDRFSAQLIGLVNQMLSVDPMRRPSIREIMVTPLFHDQGLPLLQINVRRITSLDESVRSRLLSDVETALNTKLVE